MIPNHPQTLQSAKGLLRHHFSTFLYKCQYSSVLGECSLYEFSAKEL